MRFAVLVDSYIGRGIPLGIAMHRSRVFSRALTKVADVIEEASVDCTFL